MTDPHRSGPVETRRPDPSDIPAGERGVTLLEMLAVLAIIGLIAALAAPQVVGYLDRSRVDAAEVQIKSLDTVLDMYRMDVGRYPEARVGLTGLVSQPEGAERWNGPYLRSGDALTDPWGNTYGYDVSEDGQSASVYSLGADGAEGGEGNAADIGR